MGHTMDGQRREVLPFRISLANDEALDSFLERLARENGLRPTQLLGRIKAMPGSAEPTMAFLMFKPDPQLLDRVERLTGIDRISIENATLARFGSGLPLHLDRLDPTRRHTFRQVVTQGWFPQFGSQVCPNCVAQEGIWRVRWRLPILAVCVHHGVFLVTYCTGCGQRFRTHRYSPLRPILDASQPCANPVALRTPCQHSVLAHSPLPAAPGVLAAAGTVERALEGEPIMMLGAQVDPRSYLAELRHVATLLLHLLSRPGGTSAADWVDDLHREAMSRTTPRRGPRWGISPPNSAMVRGSVLAEAQQILTQNSLEAAAEQLTPWLTLIADVPNGPAVWLRNRTKRTITMGHLIDIAVARRHHVGRRLARTPEEHALQTTAIPQLIDTAIFDEFFEDMLGSYEWTGRVYVSVCVARAVTRAANWADAATAIGLDPCVGTRTARAASGRMRVSPEVFADAVRRAERALSRHRNFRERESRVRSLAKTPAQWREQWCGSVSPRVRSSSLSYAITWMWCEVAQGPLDSSPAWPLPPSRPLKIAYRAFRGRLTPPAEDTLRSLVLG